MKFSAVYVYLRDDLVSYARTLAAEERRSLSSALAHLIEQGAAAERKRGGPG